MTDILKLAEQAQQTTDPLGFQIRRAIAAEDELRATKQTLEHAYAALQKVADAQAAIEEPELLWREIADCVIAALGDRAGILSLDVDAEIEEEIRQEVADTIQAEVRAGMVQQTNPYEGSLRTVLNAVNAYLPPDGISAHELINRVVAAVDPWPVNGDQT